MVQEKDYALFPTLAAVARRLGLDVGEMAEAALHAVDCGAERAEAVRMSIIETLQRRGAYRGWLRRAIEDGTIFQMAVDDDAADQASDVGHPVAVLPCAAGMSETEGGRA